MFLLALVGCAVLATVALSGSAAAQVGENGSVDLEDPIYADQTEFDVAITSLETDDGTGCLTIFRNGNQKAQNDSVEEGETLTFTEEDVDGIESDDQLTAELGGSLCDGSLDSDSTTVNQTGSVEFERSIFADTTEFDVTVTSLRADGGCLGLKKNGEIVVEGDTVQEGETVTFTESQVGGIEAGANFTALLGGVDCSETIASASRIVTQRGRVVLDDALHEAQKSFEVTVTDLRVDDDAGCVKVKNTGDSPVTETDFREGETRTMTESEVGYLTEGDTVTATLYAKSTCEGTTLDTDSTTVGPAPTPTETPVTPSQTGTATPGSTPTDDGTPSPSTPTTAPASDSAARFQVTIDSVEPPEGTGGTLQVHATIENTGEGPGTQTVNLRVDDETLDSQSLTLADGESRTVTFTSHVPADTDLRRVEVSSENDIEEAAVTTEDDGSIADAPGFGFGAGLVGLVGALASIRRWLTGASHR